MSGPPLSLSINPTATPKSFHTPIPVPVHWQDKVKASLDRDVRQGVLEKVPLGTPVTWCHRMVICTKKNGSLRRTINFQPLNRHATRETHHCQSHFHQARAVPRQTKKTVFDAWNGYLRSPWQKKTATSQHLSPRGGGIATARHPKAISLRVMPTQPGMMPSLLV